VQVSALDVHPICDLSGPYEGDEAMCLGTWAMHTGSTSVDGGKKVFEFSPDKCRFYTRGATDLRPDGFLDLLNILKPAVEAQASFKSAIFDGELCVWNKEASWFEDFSNIRPVLGAAKTHLPAGTIIREVRQEDEGTIAIPLWLNKLSPFLGTACLAIQ
jgi:hypothetical protein